MILALPPGLRTPAWSSSHAGAEAGRTNAQTLAFEAEDDDLRTDVRILPGYPFSLVPVGTTRVRWERTMKTRS